MSCLWVRNLVSNKRRPLSCGRSKPIKPVVKTGRNEVKPPVLSSGELGVSSGSEEDAWKEESEDETHSKCFYSAGLFSEYNDGEEWV